MLRLILCAEVIAMTANGAQHPKVVVIGAGSLFFGRQSIRQMVFSPLMREGTLALVDTDASSLERMVRLARMVAEAEGAPLAVEGSRDRREVLRGADFVVLSFARKSARYRGIDCATSARYGIRMCSGDTIGPGGLFRTMRELPEIMACTRDVEELCPDAWVINYINPTAVHGIALARYAPKLKSFALCDSLQGAKMYYARLAGIVGANGAYDAETERAFDIVIAGVNHFTWLVKAEHRGADVMPAIAECLRREGTQGAGGDYAGWNEDAYDSAAAYELYSIYGCIPACIVHTKEYVRFWQGSGKTKETLPPLPLWDPEKRYRRHEDMWRQVDSFLSGALPIAGFMDAFGSDPAIDIIENMVGGLGKRFYINTFNKGAVRNMAGDAYLELLCDSSMGGIDPLPAGEMPRGIRGMQEQVLDVHELAVQSVMERSYAKLRRAMMTDPLVSSIGDADALLGELLAQERDILPGYWYEESRGHSGGARRPA